MLQNKQPKIKCFRSDENNKMLSSILFRRTEKKKHRYIAREEKKG